MKLLRENSANINKVKKVASNKLEHLDSGSGEMKEILYEISNIQQALSNIAMKLERLEYQRKYAQSEESV